MRLAAILGLLALLAAPAAVAEITPQPGPGDRHIQTVLYDAQQVVGLTVAMGYALTVEFSSDEKIEAVSVGNSGAWQVTADKEASRLFIKPMQASLDTNMTVITDTRIYAFQLHSWPAADPSLPYVVRFQYPVAPQPTQQPAAPESPAGNAETTKDDAAFMVSYHYSGPERLRPAGMNDDGRSTFIAWPEKTPIPAVFVVEENGRTALANGAVRDGRLVIDQVATKFIFRSGGDTARVTRYLKKVRVK